MLNAKKVEYKISDMIAPFQFLLIVMLFFFPYSPVYSDVLGRLLSSFEDSSLFESSPMDDWHWDVGFDVLPDLWQGSGVVVEDGQYVG